jgi:hypothetical protein
MTEKKREIALALAQVKDFSAQQSFRLMYERLSKLDSALTVDADILASISSKLDLNRRIKEVLPRHAELIANQPTFNIFGLPEGEVPQDEGGGFGGGGGVTYGGEAQTFGGCSSDAISPGSINWLHTNASSWSRTSTISSITIGPSSVNFPHSKSGSWPVSTINGTAVEGNPWFFANIGGTWYGATWEWLRPGQTGKSIAPNDYGPHIKVSPMSSWTPSPGELVGFMVSTRARDGGGYGDERSSICTFNFPNFEIVTAPPPPIPGDQPGGGGDLPRPTSRLSVVSDVARDFPQYLQNSCQPAGGTWQFMDEVVRRLRQESPRWGYNLKRGGPSLSEDVVDYYYGQDPGQANGSTKVYIFDIIGGHCGANPQPIWLDQTTATARAGSIGRWKYPR